MKKNFVLQWGLLITFIELLKNPRYAFWNRPFTRSAPEIERVFDTVARSLTGSNTNQGAPLVLLPVTSEPVDT